MYKPTPRAEIAGKKIVLYEDYLTAITGDKLPIDLPKENVLKFILEDESWIAIRPHPVPSLNVNTILV